MVFYLRAVVLYLWVFISSLLIFPLAIVRIGNPENNQAYARLFGGIARWIMGIRLEVENPERIAPLYGKSYVMLVNHQHALDIATLAAVLPKRILVIGKREVLFIPIWGFMFAAFGNLLINRANRTQAVQALQGLIPVILRKRAGVFIFPEGTRNKTLQGLLPFKRGGFHLAHEARAPILPVVSSSLAPALDKARGFRRVTIKIKVLELISTQDFPDLTTCMQVTREKMLAALNS